MRSQLGMRSSSRAGALRRGKACFVCRKYKIKCDGARPYCGPCQNNPRDEPCGFEEIKSRTQELESTVACLQRRVAELEQSQRNSSSWSACSSDYSSSSSLWSTYLQAGNSFRAGHTTIQELPPPTFIDLFFDNFFPHATHFDFFLDPEAFISSLRLPTAHPDRPSPSLLSAISLLIAYLSNHDLASPDLPKRAQRQIATEISGPPIQILHTIQAQVLLAHYLLRQRRFLEAEYQINGAATLVMAYQLHRISPTTQNKEGIRAFWAVACLQSSMNINIGRSTSSAAALSILETSSSDIDAPWPGEETRNSNCAQRSSGS